MTLAQAYDDKHDTLPTLPATQYDNYARAGGSYPLAHNIFRSDSSKVPPRHQRWD